MRGDYFSTPAADNETHTHQFYYGMSNFRTRTIRHYTQVTYFYQNVFRYVAIHFCISLYLRPTLKLQQAYTLFQYKVAMTRFTLFKSVVFNNCPTNVTYSVYYISVGSSTYFGHWHPSSGARTTIITASGID